MRRVLLALVVAVSCLVPGAPAHATTPLKKPVWLCKPGLPGDVCEGRYPDGYATDLDATVDGVTEPLEGTDDPPIDCFYAYPTVNLLPNPMLPIGDNPPVARDAEVAVTLTQVGRLTGRCRMFVPLYRQAPLTAYVLGLLLPQDFETGYQDLKQAFTEYWNTENQGRRGVVVLGHSQGAAQMARLLQEEFDGTPKSEQLVSAFLLGADVKTSTFQHLPACARPSPADPVPTGCVVAYSAYDMDPADVDRTALGRTADPAQPVLCVNPAQLLTGGTAFRPYLPARPLLRGNALTPNGSLTLLLGDYRAPAVPTGFAGYPGRVTGHCAQATGAKGQVNWLQVDGAEELKKSGFPLGLHTVDFNVDSGNLADLVTAQGVAWTAR
ncbi:DUF3089 domain-containing protein [Nonomuraea sp. NPDC050556]|uniref:DUF3089 domain-containing protein n=1 Tax=Nonomuraea sp. NPDC050556 TaxID=3364369 RepID=UPI0037A3D104